DVADRPDVSCRRAAMIVDADEASLVELDAGIRSEQPVGIRTPSDADDQLVDLDLRGLTALLVTHGDRVAAPLRARDFRAETDVEALALELLQSLGRDLLVRVV